MTDDHTNQPPMGIEIDHHGRGNSTLTLDAPSWVVTATVRFLMDLQEPPEAPEDAPALPPEPTPSAVSLDPADFTIAGERVTFDNHRKDYLLGAKYITDWPQRISEYINGGFFDTRVPELFAEGAVAARILALLYIVRAYHRGLAVTHDTLGISAAIDRACDVLREAVPDSLFVPIRASLTDTLADAAGSDR